MCATLNDFLKDKKLWVAVQAVKEFPFLEGNLVMVMESSLKVMYGQRLMFSPFNDLSVEEVAQQLVMLHGDKWEQLTTAKSDLNLAGDYIIRKKGTSKKDVETVHDSVDRNQTVAYNETELDDESGSTKKATDKVAETGNDSQDTEKVSYTSYFNNLQNADRLDIMNLILRDAAKLLTISVY